jgi:ComF family protein
MISLLDFLFPKRCLRCNKVGEYICNRCKRTIVLREQRCPECDHPAIDGITHPKCLRKYGLDGLVTIFKNEGIIKKAIKQLKYQFVSDLAESLTNLIPLSTLQSLMLLNDQWVLYPIPLHKDRLSWRGFNQAELLGEYVLTKLQIPLAKNLLIRIAKRTPQADITNRDTRLKNAKGLFSMNPNILVSKYPSILLFDDVWTTGATMK